MPKHVAKLDPHFAAAAQCIKKYLNMSLLPEAMKLSDFSAKEQACCAMRMFLHRLLKKSASSSIITKLPPSCINVSMRENTASSMSVGSIAVEEAVLVVTTPKIRLTAKIRHATVVNERRKVNEAFKRATIMYSHEREKGDEGMSSGAVAEIIEKEIGVKISKSTIQKKVKARNVGTSPLRWGPKGHIPPLHYCNLCLAYESFITTNQLNGMMRNCRQKVVGGWREMQ